MCVGVVNLAQVSALGPDRLVLAKLFTDVEADAAGHQSHVALGLSALPAFDQTLGESPVLEAVQNEANETGVSRGQAGWRRSHLWSG